MSNTRNLIAQIREYEQNATFARRTNEKELPSLKFLVSDIDKFELGESDLDLKQDVIKISERINSLEVSDISQEVLDECRLSVAAILETLANRYQERMEAYASRQGHL